MLGYEIDELIAHTARKLMDPDEIDMVRENLIMKGETVRYEAKAIAKDIEYNGDHLVAYENGKIVGAEA